MSRNIYTKKHLEIIVNAANEKGAGIAVAFDDKDKPTFSRADADTPVKAVLTFADAELIRDQINDTGLAVTMKSLSAKIGTVKLSKEEKVYIGKEKAKPATSAKGKTQKVHYISALENVLGTDKDALESLSNANMSALKVLFDNICSQSDQANAMLQEAKNINLKELLQQAREEV